MTTSTLIQTLDADFSRVDPRAVALLAERWARRHLVVPISVENGTIIVATADPLDLDAERTVGFATGHRVRWERASNEEIAYQLDRVYSGALTRKEAPDVPVEVQHLGFVSENTTELPADSGASVIRMVDQLIAEAISSGASDLHLEPEEQGIAVRHRVDGVLRGVRTLPRSAGAPLVSRVKILSGLDIADRMRPQDGRARVAILGSVIDLRVSTLPVSHGEKIVIRVLDGSAGLRTLEAIGFGSDELLRIRGLLQQREGLLLVTGPTGSGKTTTLYAALREIQLRGVNVVTVEDPIEYRLPGIVQVQVHERAGLTFGAALRSIVRQDPDVILVGEIRDRETAEIAIQASLTGHLVLSTLHTNDAASAVTRLIDIGVASYQIATAVKGVVAQRLVRRLCADCRGSGCDRCEGGYRGRRAIAEILVTSPEFERRVAAGASTESLSEAARDGGCLTLWESGVALVRSGETTMEELRRVAAEPVRQIREPVRSVPSRKTRLTVLWITGSSSGTTADLENLQADHEKLRDAEAAALSTEANVAIIPIAMDFAKPFPALPSCDALVTPLELARVARSSIDKAQPRPSLVLAWVRNTSHLPPLQPMDTGADLVLPCDTSGTVILSTVLALLTWRAATVSS